jgi:hypothetical protein
LNDEYDPTIPVITHGNAVFFFLERVCQHHGLSGWLSGVLP